MLVMMTSRTPRTPESLVEYQTRFATEEACCLYLEERRWPNGYFCPNCHYTECYRLISRRLLQCKGCRHQTSITAGTIMHRTKLPLRYWFWVILQMAWHKRSISAKQVMTDLGVGSYETAWLLCHKVRESMNGGQSLLDGTVEVDDAYVGGVKPGCSGRQAGGKSGIVVAMERKPIHTKSGITIEASGDCAIRLVPSMAAAYLQPAVQGVIRAGSTVKTDGWSSYVGLGAAGYTHQTLVGGVGSLPLADRAISNLKRWLLCTFAGRLTEKHLQRYLNEFTFRWNRRKRIKSMLSRIARRSMRHEPFSYEMLIQ